MKLKRMMIVATIAATMSVSADTEKVGDYTYTYRIIGDGAEIYNGGNVAVSPAPTGTLIIPSMLGGKAVSFIGAYAFNYCRDLTAVVIPDSVASIGQNAFYYCDKLATVSIGDGVTSIGDHAFECCWAVKTVTIPQHVCGRGLSSVFSGAYSSITRVVLSDNATNVVGDAFSGCSALASVEAVDGNPSYMTVSGMLLTRDGKTLVAGPNGAVEVPEGVEAIGNGAFRGHSITSLSLPTTLKSIARLSKKLVALKNF